MSEKQSEEKERIIKIMSVPINPKTSRYHITEKQAKDLASMSLAINKPEPDSIVNIKIK